MPEIHGSSSERKLLYRQVAAIHCLNINQGFLHTLGERFLALLYESIDKDQNSVLYIAEANGIVVGFVAGGRGMSTIYRQILRQWPRLFFSLIPAIFSPRKICRIFEILWFGRKQKPVQECPAAELFSIAVISSMRRSGVAKALYQELATRFFRNGENSFCIVVGENLTSAHRFYLGMGAEPMAKVTVHKGQVSTLYRQKLPITN